MIQTPSIHIIDSPTGLLITGWGQGTCAHLSLPVSIPRGHAERVLTNLSLHIISGVNPSRILEHISYHKHADPSCPCCKIEGRVLTSQGRRPVSETDRLIARRAHTGGSVQVRHIKPGLSGAQLKAHEEAYFKRQASPKKTSPQYPEPVRFVPHNIEDLI